MRRQRRPHHYDDDDFRSNYNQLNGHSEDFLQMQSLQNQPPQHKFENTIEAKVEEGDTLQALALRFHCAVADIKRLNKIDKENEIHARKVVKIPVTIHSVLLETIPTVHKSGNNSPKHASQSNGQLSDKNRNPLEDAKIMLEEQLLVASVNAAGSGTTASSDGSINRLLLNSRVQTTNDLYTDEEHQLQPTVLQDINTDAASPLLSGLLDDSLPQPRPIRGPSLSAIDWSGSDCDMSWVCLFVIILALCFVIPLLYILYLAEHPHHHHNTTH